MGNFRQFIMKYDNKCGTCGKELPAGTKSWSMKSSFAGSKWRFECMDCHNKIPDKTVKNITIKNVK